MAAPRSGLNPTTLSVGFSVKLVTVSAISANGLTAQTVDRQNTQTQVPMMTQRSKGPLPKAGETWLLAQDLGSWTFAAFVGTSPSDFVGGSSGAVSGGTAIVVSATAPANPGDGDLWMDAATGNEILQWSGTDWTALQFGAGAIASGAITAAQVAPGTITTEQLAPSAGITAEQVAFSATDIGGTKVITGTSQPANPKIGALWVDPDSGNALREWNGDEWVSYQFGAPAIAPGSLTGAQISAAAGITSEQVDFTARDIGGITTSVSLTQPASPATGDLWFDGTHNYLLKQWNGTAWAPYQFGTNAIQAGSVTAALIAANTITATQIAAGTVIAGVVNGTTIEGAQFIAYGSNGEILIYSGLPGAGNLIGAWSASPGSDGLTNSYTGGLNVGSASAPQVLVIPALGGGSGSAVAFPFNTADDTSQTAIVGEISNATLVNQFLQLLINGPVNTSDTSANQYVVALSSASDDNTLAATLMITDSAGVVYLGFGNPGGDAPAITVGQPPPGADAGYGATFVPIGLSGALLTYGTSAGQTSSQTFTKSGTMIVPPGVTSMLQEAWAPGGGGGGGSAPSQFGDGGASGGGGEYAAQTVTVVPGDTITVSVGGGGSPGAPGTPNGSPGGNGGNAGTTTISGGSATVTAHGGQGGTGGHNGHAGGAAGTGSTNSVHHSGGNGASAPTDGTATGGAGGGGAGGPATGGTGGAAAYSRTPAAGGRGNPGGGGGGQGGGGGWGSTGNNGSVGGKGSAPGGGGGGGGGGTDAHTWGGGGGANGMARLTWTQPGGAAIQASWSSDAGTDGDGNAFPAGHQGPVVAVEPGASPSVPETWHTVSYANSWGPAATGLDLKYQVTPDGYVHLSGRLVAGATVSSSGPTTLTTLPAGYQPARTEPISVLVHNATSPYAVNTSFFAVVDTNGTIALYGNYNSGQNLEIQTRFPLSA